MICVCCQHREAEWPRVCNGDRQRLRDTLRQIVELYAELPAALEPGRGGGPRVSGSREAPLPLRLAALDMLGPGTPSVSDRFADQVGELPPAVLLDQWVRDWVDARDQAEHVPPPVVAGLVTWLLNRLDWACDDHPAIDEFAQEITKLHRGLVTVLGQSEGKYFIGFCPTQREDGQRCGKALTADPWIDRIACPRCRTEWPREKWKWLGSVLTDAGEPTEPAA